MPQWGAGNSRAIEARMRKKMEKDRKQKELEEKRLDEYWKDDDKKAQAKIQRKKATNTKITQAQILQRLIEEKKKEMKDEKKKTENTNVHEMELEDNINHIIRDEMNNYDECINATGIDNIINSLGNVSFEKTKKVKAAYKKYEEENLPLVKEEYKNLKLSQYKQILWKKFKKSADNPMNQKD
ncbi:conserved protein, unknown function [Plasmodium vinckei]|uniref:Coiled-coil domain-containing protein n=1 Tax=Plasmodium vinckei TaxID=5860 RepID=A0A6V7SR05_PLAVN|nr:conserved protein, unknown function [Plasmodium vinckei]